MNNECLKKREQVYSANLWSNMKSKTVKLDHKENPSSPSIHYVFIAPCFPVMVSVAASG